MAGIKISALPAIPSSQLTDIAPFVQGGVTYKVTNNQLITLFNTNIQIGESQVTNLTTDLAAKLNLSGGTMTGALILNTSSPTTALQAASKGYVDTIASGITVQGACYAASTTALTVTYSNGTLGIGATLTNAGAQAVFTIDGTTPALNSRILIKNQASTFQNGIYTVTNVGSVSTNWVLTRATDYDEASEINPGDLVIINNGTLNANSSWLETATVTTIGTDPITFSTFFEPSNYISSTLTSANIIVGNSSNVATAVAMSGDTTISNTGAVTIGNNKVSNAKMAQMASFTIRANNTSSTANSADVATSAYAPTIQRFTSGSGTYNTPSGATWLRVRLWGAGGGGGGSANTAAGGAGSGTGGDGGGYVEHIITSPAASYSYGVGASGAGATAGNNGGSNGGDTTFSTLTASGGGGGGGGAAIATNSQLAATPAFAPGTGTGGNESNLTGGYAQYSAVFFGGGPQATNNSGGNGANGGPGGAQKIGQGTGTTGATPGGGGGGGVSLNAGGTAAGGPGGAGLIVVEEHYI